MNTDFLTKIGLSEQQIAVYMHLLEHGPARASALTAALPYKKSLMYKILGDLEELGVVTKEDAVGQVSLFHPEHPMALRALAERREQEARDVQVAIDGALGPLTSLYNLSIGKPGVEFYEGRAGVEKVLRASLDAEDMIYTYGDIETMDRYAGEINAAYVDQRLKRKITNKLLVIDTNVARAVARSEKNAYTEFRMIKNEDAPAFQSVLKIYDGTVSYITFGENILTATMISDPLIARMHRYLFEVLWDKSQSVL